MPRTDHKMRIQAKPHAENAKNTVQARRAYSILSLNRDFPIKSLTNNQQNFNMEKTIEFLVLSYA